MMTTAPRREDPPDALARVEDGRWLGGVCAGLARARGLPVGRLRAAFVLAALAGGLGVLVYLACWLIVPAEGEPLNGAGPRGIVVLAQVCAGCAGLATLVAIGAGATVFGFGWVVVACGAAVLVGALVCWPRLGPAWALLPVAALVLPAVALAAGGVRLAPQRGHVTFAPAAIGDAPREGYRSGLGTMLIDLRDTALPARGSRSLRVEAGVRRTIVALPHDRCVNVRVRYDIAHFAGRAARLLSGHGDQPISEAVVFGNHRWGGAGVMGNDDRGRGPTLAIDFTSQGGSLFVRDYPDRVDPDLMPDWPGYPVDLERRPDTTGTPRRAAQRLVRNWRARHRVQARSKRRIAALRPGPCARRERR
jgi:phage shock protein PspC (stress-responsive transcriptional regulator)